MWNWLIENVFLSVYAGVALAGLGYFLAKLIRFPFPPAIAGIIFITFGLFGPTYPRYKFEQDTRTEIAQYPHFKIARVVNWGSFTEPLTWVLSFPGTIAAVAPNPLERTASRGVYQEVVFRFQEPKRIYVHDVDCEDGTIWTSMPDEKGTFRYLTNTSRPIEKGDKAIFCETDWTPQLNAARAMLLRGSPRSGN